MFDKICRNACAKESSRLAFRTFTALAAVVIGTYASAASSASVTFNFTGTTTYALSAPYYGLGTHLGDTLTGSYTFDTALQPRTDYGIYGSYASDYYQLDALSLHVGNINFALGPYVPGDWQDTRIIVANNYTGANPYLGDHYIVKGDRWGTYEFKIDLADPTMNALQDTSLPLAPPDLSSFATRTWTLYAPGQDWGRYHTMDLVASGTITSLQVASVPIPAAGWLLLSGVAGLGALARRASGMRAKPM